MNATKMIDCAESDPFNLTATLPLPPQAQCSESIQPPPWQHPGTSELTGAQEAPASDFASTSGTGGDHKLLLEQARREMKKRALRREQARNWLMADPQG